MQPTSPRNEAEFAAIKQVTESDSRFYVRGDEFRPSVTYIQSVGFPTPTHLQKWKADLGWDEAEEVKNKAADSGSTIHNSIEKLLKGKRISTIDMNTKEKRSIKAFLDWYDEERPQVIRFEYKIWADDYAGTVDLLCKLKSDDYQGTWLIDYKSGGVYSTGKSQIMAYKMADPEATRCAILQLGNQTKKAYTFSEVKPDDEQGYWDLFQQCNAMYKLLRPKDKPAAEFPLYFSLNLKKYARTNIKPEPKALPQNHPRKNRKVSKKR